MAPYGVIRARVGAPRDSREKEEEQASMSTLSARQPSQKGLRTVIQGMKEKADKLVKRSESRSKGSTESHKLSVKASFKKRSPSPGDLGLISTS